MIPHTSVSLLAAMLRSAGWWVALGIAAAVVGAGLAIEFTQSDAPPVEVAGSMCRD